MGRSRYGGQRGRLAGMADAPNIIAQMQAALARIPEGGRMTMKLAPWCWPAAEAIKARGEEVTVEALAKEMGWPLPAQEPKP